MALVENNSLREVWLEAQAQSGLQLRIEKMVVVAEAMILVALGVISVGHCKSCAKTSVARAVLMLAEVEKMLVTLVTVV
jgi:hypothetical protein